MAVAPLRQCMTNGCPTLTTSGHCPAHRRPAWTKYKEVPRLRGPELQALRAALFAREPLCRLCYNQGIVTPATIRDHILPLGEGGTEDEANTQPVCQRCHNAKSYKESQRGKFSRARLA